MQMGWFLRDISWRASPAPGTGVTISQASEQSNSQKGSSYTIYWYCLKV
jgi:hypothetical protein